MQRHLHPRPFARFGIALTLLVLPVCSHAAIQITFSEVGLDLHVTTSGSLNMSGLTNPASPPNGLTVTLDSGTISSFSSSPQNAYLASNPIYGITSINFNIPHTTNNPAASPTSSIGIESFGFHTSNGTIFTSSGYTGGAISPSTNILENTSFQDFGITPGILGEVTFTTATGGDTIQAIAVPEPSSALLLLTGALVLKSRRRALSNRDAN